LAADWIRTAVEVLALGGALPFTFTLAFTFAFAFAADGFALPRVVAEGAPVASVAEVALAVTGAAARVGWAGLVLSAADCDEAE
jgi:hypothetical protein